MFSAKDLTQIQERGSTLDTVQEQIENFKTGFPFLRVIKAATINDGLLRLSDDAVKEYVEFFDKQADNLTLLKFVPASGAASRMFKTLFEYMDIAQNTSPSRSNKAIQQFFSEIDKFAFSHEFPKSADDYHILRHLLTEDGLDYGNLPKGLLAFHQYGNQTRTPIEEHLVEGASYARANGVVRIHLTVSPEHRSKFDALIERVLPKYEALLGVKFDISFSEQKPSTDTIAVCVDNTPFRNADDTLLFRPAGHGALLENLNDQKADLVFIKNIDNVVPDHLKPATITYKKALAGVLLTYQKRIFGYLRLLNNDADINENIINEINTFLTQELCVLPPKYYEGATLSEKVAYQKQKLNRPLRVCGMVQNVGEPGGGPFWANNEDGSVSLQVVESAQINLDDSSQKQLFETATHFNPVDLVCSLKNANTEKYNLLDFRDPKTGFITEKSQGGKTLKAQELPGLWNGSMANWNTVFVEVPLITFNPVKTVNDLLRAEHQPQAK